MPGPQPTRYHNLYPSHSKSPTCTLPKKPSRNLSKNRKTPLTIVIHIAIIIKLSRGGSRGKPFYQQLVRVF